MATYSGRLDKTETAASLKAKMAAFELLYGESDFYIQHGLVWVQNTHYGLGISAETLSLWEKAEITKVQGHFVHILWRADDLTRSTWSSKMYLPCYTGVRYSDPMPELYFMTKR